MRDWLQQSKLSSILICADVRGRTNVSVGDAGDLAAGVYRR